VMIASRVCKAWRATALELLLGDTACSRPPRLGSGGKSRGGKPATSELSKRSTVRASERASECASVPPSALQEPCAPPPLSSTCTECGAAAITTQAAVVKTDDATVGKDKDKEEDSEAVSKPPLATTPQPTR
jgi:hypothetical protein